MGRLESTMETDVTERKVGSHGNLLCDAGSSKPALHDHLEGRDGVGDRKAVQEGGDMPLPVTDSCCCVAGTNTIL